MACQHERLHLGSGDYYVFCSDCQASWVRCELGKDVGNPSLANQGFVADSKTRTCKIRYTESPPFIIEDDGA